MNLNIRTATISDLPQIMNVEQHGFIPQIQEQAAVFEARIRANPDLFLIFEDSEIQTVAGYLSAEYMKTIPSSANELSLGHTPAAVSKSQETYIYISSYSLLPQYRGGGIGKQMWNSSISWFENTLGAKKILLLVNEEWQGAKHIYENSGFQTVAIFQNFFPSEKDDKKSAGILMERK